MPPVVFLVFLVLEENPVFASNLHAVVRVLAHTVRFKRLRGCDDREGFYTTA